MTLRTTRGKWPAEPSDGVVRLRSERLHTTSINTLSDSSCLFEIAQVSVTGAKHRLDDGGRTQPDGGSRSASIALYRPQAELSGGRFDGKFDVR